LLHTILHRTNLIIFPLTLQTITTTPMMSIWGKGGLTLSEVNTDKFLALEIWHKGINAPSIRSPLLLLSCASSMGRHNRSATQQHHYLQSAAWTSHQQALSTDRNRWCETPFVALHRHTGQSRPVTISSGRHRNDPAQCGSDSGDHCRRGRSKPGCRIAGSAIKWELTTEAEFHWWMKKGRVSFRALTMLVG